MKTVTLGIADRRMVTRRATEAFKGRRQGAHISFATPELLFLTLTAKRWEIVRSMTGAGAMSIRALARRMSRDVKAVHADVHALLNAGILRRNDEGLIEFPFDAIRVDMMLTAS